MNVITKRLKVEGKLYQDNMTQFVIKNQLIPNIKQHIKSDYLKVKGKRRVSKMIGEA